MSKFEEQFSEPVRFIPDGLYLNRSIPKGVALEYFREFEIEYYGKTDIKDEDIKEAHVRFQPVPSEMRDDLQDMAWMVCRETDRNAQPCWVVE